MEETAFNPKRRLCPDGSCVGVLGPDGRCSVCQRPPGAGAESGVEEPAEAWARTGDDAGAKERGEDARAPESAEGAASGFNPTRRLCDDGSCVGIVGADGLCGVCGQRAQ